MIEWKVTSRANYDTVDFPGVFTDLEKEPSQTIPNQALSLQDLVNRFTISSEWPKIPIEAQFDNEQTLDLPEIGKFSKMELEEYKLSVKEHIEDTKEELAELKANNAKAIAHQKAIAEIKPTEQSEENTE